MEFKIISLIVCVLVGVSVRIHPVDPDTAGLCFATAFVFWLVVVAMFIREFEKQNFNDSDHRRFS